MQPPADKGVYTFIVEITQTNDTKLIDTTTIKLY